MDSNTEQLNRYENKNSNMKVDAQLYCYESKLSNSIAVLNRMLDEYKPNEIFLSFNGGKDCTVLLHLVSSLFAKRHPSQPLLCLYIQPRDPFEEIDEFVKHCEDIYNILLEVVPGDTKTALEEICDRRKELKACVMGSRSTDPYCSNLNSFQETDPGWPSLMRINPLLEWTCSDIWKFLHQNNVPYCSLYKYGYTSIGDKSNTVPNPHLKYLNALTGEVKYKHADQLENAIEFERAGRIKLNKST